MRKLIKAALLTLFVTPALFASGYVKGKTLTASWYEHHEGGQTANGERYDPEQLTCAHRWLPFGTRLLVEYKGRKVIVRVNDRGPHKRFKGKRDIDLSRGAFRILSPLEVGLLNVKVSVLSVPWHARHYYLKLSAKD